MTRKRAPLLRYSADWYPVSRTLLAASAVLLPFCAEVPWFVSVLITIWIFPLRRMAALHQHNHGHLKTFHSRPLNAIYDVVLVWVTGFVTAGWELHHNIGHHRYFLKESQDVLDLSRFGCEDGSLRSRVKFTLLGELFSYPDCLRIAGSLESKKERREKLGKFLFQVCLQIGMLGVCTIVRPFESLVLLWIPSLLLRWGIFWVAYRQHLFTDTSSVYTACNSILHQPLDRLNVGHHTAHHEKPTLHWSLLPARTQKILSMIPASRLRQTAADPVQRGI